VYFVSVKIISLFVTEVIKFVYSFQIVIEGKRLLSGDASLSII